MARPDFIRDQLKITKALVKFIRDHQNGVDRDLAACLAALEKDDIELAVRHARMVKPHGMSSVTDWFPPVTQNNETPEYNVLVLRSLINEWCRMMSLSFDELDRVQRDSQVGELEAKKKPDGHALCPFCRKIFSTTSAPSWDGSRHVTCGVRLRFVSVEKFQN